MKWSTFLLVVEIEKVHLKKKKEKVHFKIYMELHGP